MKDIIKIVMGHKESGLLCPINPAFRTVKRRVWVTPEIFELLDAGPWDDEKQEIEWAEAKAKIEHVAAGNRISVGNKATCQMAPLVKPPYPPHWDVWDIRSKNKRILGHFIDRDFYIGLDWAERRNLNSEEDWETTVKRCRAKWRNLFQGFKPFKKEGEYESYLSNIHVDKRYK